MSIKSFFKDIGEKTLNLSIKAKFNFIAAATGITFIVIILVALLSTQTSIRYRNYNANLDELLNKYLEFKKYKENFLLRYTEDEMFFVSGNNKYLEKCYDVFTEIEMLLEKLEEHPISKDIEIKRQITEIQDEAIKYRDLFNLLVAKLRERGNRDVGTIGQISKITQKLAELNNNVVVGNYLLQLKEYEKKYVLYQDYVYSDRFKLTFDKLQNYINTGEIEQNQQEIIQDTIMTSDTLEVGVITTPEIQETDSLQNDSLLTDSIAPSANRVVTDKKLIETLNLYNTYFNALIDISDKIGLKADEGIRGQMNNQIERFDSQLELIRQRILKTRKERVTSMLTNIFIAIFIILLILIVLILRFSRTIVLPINQLRQYIQALSRGELPADSIKLKNHDEIYQMAQAVNDLIQGLKKTSRFASAIGKGEFNTEFTPLSEKDALGNALLEMRNSLKTAKEEEQKRKEEDAKRSWATEGIAKFSDIVRQSTENITDLGYNIISNLVDYVNANQGGIFIYNDEDKENIHLELIASYAYNRRKYLDRKVLPGEGLVGTCALEKKTIHLKKIPKEYIEITSGLGQSVPRSLLIVPLKMENKILGIIEIASFNEFEKYQIRFVEEIAEDIAVTLSSAKINEQTNALLNKFRKQSEEMAAQEEEMRQNLEELQATQEAAAQKEAEMSNIVNAMDQANYVIEYDMQGKIIRINDKFESLLELSDDQVIGKDYHEIIDIDDNERYEQLWRDLRQGKIRERVNHIQLDNKEIWLKETYSPIFDKDGIPYKVLNIAIDITREKQLEKKLEQ